MEGSPPKHWSSTKEDSWLKVNSAGLSQAERLATARDLMDGLIASRRFNTLADVSPILDRTGLGREGQELSLYGLFMARRGQHQSDLALQIGEKYLKEFPLSRRFREIESSIRDIIEGRRRQEVRHNEYLTDIQEHRAGLYRDGGVPAESRLQYDYAPCIAARWDGQVNDLMLKSCSEFLEKHGGDQGDLARSYRLGAKFFVILAHQGEFVRARPMIEKLEGETHDWDEELHKLMSDRPTD